MNTPDDVTFLAGVPLTARERALALDIEHATAVRCLLACVAMRSSEVAEHGRAVAAYAAVLAERMTRGQAHPLDADRIAALMEGARLHDAGKIGIPDRILLKPGALEPEERAGVQAHPVHGYSILAPYALLREAALIARHHHERWDGTGYPDRLRGLDIPWGARLVALCDVYHALTADRVYHSARTYGAARRIIADGSGTQFDPLITAAFLAVPPEEWMRAGRSG